MLRRNLQAYMQFWGVQLHTVDSLEDAERYLVAQSDTVKPVLMLGPAWPAPSPALAHLQTLLLTFRHDKASTNNSLPASMIRVWVSPLRREDLFLALLVASGKAQPQAIGISPKDVASPRAPLLTPVEAEVQNRLILVAEDNPVNQKVIEKQLAHLGYTCLLADNGKIALDLWRQHRFALVITDCHMPEMDGFALTQAIRNGENPDTHVPIIAFTANALRGETERCLTAGMDDYLSKPVEMQSLRRTLHKWLPPA
jgi:CheY-like chemotaxis protein